MLLLVIYIRHCDCVSSTKMVAPYLSNVYELSHSIVWDFSAVLWKTWSNLLKCLHDGWWKKFNILLFSPLLLVIKKKLKKT